MSDLPKPGVTILKLIEQFEIPFEYHNALWAAYEAGADMGFFTCYEAKSKVAV